MDESIDQPVSGRGSSGFLFWSLTLMAMTAFAPCVFLPEWRDYEAIYSVQQARQQDLATFEESVREEKRKLEALQSDPATMARLAQRELSYRRTGERAVQVSEPLSRRDTLVVPVSDRDRQTAASPSLQTSPMARAVEPWIARLPDLDYDALFCDEQTRVVIMTMSLALIVLAFVLFGRRGETMANLAATTD